MDKKFNHKLEIIYIKYSPMLISLGLLVNNILSYFDIYALHEFGGILFGASILTIGHMYNSSKTFKFCKYHRMFIHYILLNLITNRLDYYVNLPITDLTLLRINLIIAGLFLFLILYYHQKYKNKDYDTTSKEVIIENNR